MIIKCAICGTELRLEIELSSANDKEINPVYVCKSGINNKSHYVEITIEDTPKHSNFLDQALNEGSGVYKP